jgi:Mg2+ and Co2+ transporter CorA
MYDMAIKNMGLEKQMEELKDEIKELYEYAEMQNDRFSADEEKRQTEENTKLNKRMLTLTKIAAFGVPLSIFLAFWGLSIELVRNDNGQIYNVIWNIPFITTMIIAVLIGVYFYKKGEK